jgi:hypothetical protein
MCGDNADVFGALQSEWLVEPAAQRLHMNNFKECFGADAVQFQRGVAPFSDSAHFPYAAHYILVSSSSL